jgi:DNA-directed RNA polymerase specialized sigma24 family protein
MAGARRGFPTKSLERRLGDLYSIHSRGTIRLAFLLTGDRGVAEDICQEAFVRVGGRLGALRDRQLKDRLPDPSATHMPDVALHDEVSRALRRLPFRQRAAVFFRYFEDLSEGQTAEVLNCSVTTVPARSLTFRAMENLRHHLQEVNR